MSRRTIIHLGEDTPQGGFFTNPHAPKKSGKKALKECQGSLFSKEEMLPRFPACAKCGLNKTNGLITPEMRVTGEGLGGVFILGEAPGKEEDRSGVQFTGEAGQKLRLSLQRHGINIDRWAWKHNAVNCRPTNATGTANRKPSTKEINSCRPMWQESFRNLYPTFLVPMGSVAIQTVFAGRSGKIFQGESGPGKWHRLCIPDPEYNAWIIPLYHPSYFVRNKGYDYYFDQEIDFLVESVQKHGATRPVFPDVKHGIELLHDYHEICERLVCLAQAGTPFAFDYETNKTRPWWNSHGPSLIHTCGIATAEGDCFAFPVMHPGGLPEGVQGDVLDALRMLMAAPNPKYVQSVQMEVCWSREILGVDPVNVVWDTLIGSHIEDCRDFYTGLKMQAYLKFGIMDYSSHLDKFMTGGTFPINILDQAPLDEVLLYNACDARITLWLAEQQQDTIKAGTRYRGAYELFHEGVYTMTNLERRGIPIKPEVFRESKLMLENRVHRLDDILDQAPEVLQFEEKFGKKPDLMASTDLKAIVYDIMKVPVKKLTKTGLSALDEEVFDSIDTDFTRMVVRKRKSKKILDYLNLFLKLNDSGFLHPAFWLNSVKTYRSSSSNPNFQNIPKRSEEALRILRSGIVPRPGGYIVEVDYGSMEVRIICCVSGDPVLARDLTEGLDMHSYWADFFKEYNLTRYDAKNGFVFPLFYGSYHVNIHKDLVARGYRIPLEKVKAAEEAFWKRYHYTLEARERAVSDYKRRGYVDTLFGHRRSGILNRNQIINTPVQGAAFHCLLWSANQVDKISIEENWQSYIMAQVHDSMFMNVYPEEEVHVLSTVHRVMTQDIRAHFPWIIVPLLAEFSRTEVDGNWAEMEEFQPPIEIEINT